MADPGVRGARRHSANPRRVDRAAAPALLRVHRLFGARDRRPRGCARLVLRRQPRPLRGCSHGGRASGAALGRGVRRLPGNRRHLHERRHGEQPDRPGGGTRAGATGLPGHGYRLGPPDRVRIGGGALLGQARRRDPRLRLERAAARPDRRPAPARAGRARRGDRPGRAGGRNPGRRRRERRAPRSRERSTRSPRSPTSARRGRSGCTSTARTDSRRQR